MEKIWFEEKRNPVEFLEMAMQTKAALGKERFYNAPGISWLREAWTIGRFGSLISADFVALNPNDPPDCYLWKDSKKFEIEITEAIRPGRERGNEYKKEQKNIEFIPQDDQPLDVSVIGDWIRNSICMKINKWKNSTTKYVFLVHLSGWSGGFERDKLREIFIQIIDKYETKEELNVCILSSNCVAGPHFLIEGRSMFW